MIKLQPELRFKEFSGDWEEKKLNSLMQFKNGINASKEAYGKGKKFINVLDILSESPIVYENIKGSVEVSNDIFNKNTVTYGDIVFQRSSETREEVGTANVYIDKENTATFGGFVIRGKKINEYDPIFMNKLLKTSSARNEITSKSGGSTRYNLSQSTLNEIILRFPSLPEQEKIASFLSSVDDKIEKLEGKKKKLRGYKKGIMQKIFSQEIRFKDENGQNFSDWEEKKFEDFTKINQGLQIPINERFFEERENRKFYITNEFLRENSEKKYFIENPSKNVICTKDDILMTRTGNTGKVVTNVEGAFHNNFFKIDFDRDKFSKEYLVYVLKSFYTQKCIARLAGTSTIPDLNHGDFYRIKNSYPTLPEQQKIADFLSSVDEKIEKVGGEIDRVKEFKKGLLQGMFV